MAVTALAASSHPPFTLAAHFPTQSLQDSPPVMGPVVQTQVCGRTVMSVFPPDRLDPIPHPAPPSLSPALCAPGPSAPQLAPWYMTLSFLKISWSQGCFPTVRMTNGCCGLRPGGDISPAFRESPVCPLLLSQSFFLSSLLPGKPKALSAKAMHQSWEDRKAGSGGRVYEMGK